LTFKKKTHQCSQSSFTETGMKVKSSGGFRTIIFAKLPLLNKTSIYLHLNDD